MVQTNQLELPIQLNCYSCECEITSGLQVKHDNQLYCQTCFDDDFCQCTKCNEIIHNDDALYSEVRRHEGSYCTDCFNDLFFNCISCEGVFNKDDRLCDPDNDDICQDCYSESYTECESCNEVISRDDANYTDDSTYCASCYEEHENDCLKFQTSKTFDENTSKRFVGIELEFIQTKDVSRLKDYGLIKDDGSVSAKDGCNGEGQEFVTYPVNGDLLYKTIDTCTDIFKGNAYINSTCGFHVHLDMRDSTITERQNVYNAWRVFESIFFDMTSQSRRENTYCKNVQGLTFDHARNADRYRSLNVTAYSKYKTFEIRLHQGSLDKVKVKNWVTLLLNFFDHFQYVKFDENTVFEVNSKTDREKLIYLFQQVKMPLSLRKYMVNRIKKFKTPDTGKYWTKPIKDSWSKQDDALLLQLESERM